MRTLIGSVAITALFASVATAMAGGEMVIEDFEDCVTPLDRSWNDFSGNRTEVNRALLSLGIRKSTDRSALNMRWDFADTEERTNLMTGFHYSLFGMLETELTFDGKTTDFMSFPEHTLDMDRLDGAIQEPGGPRRATALLLDVSRRSTNAMMLRVELEDAAGSRLVHRFVVRRSLNVQRIRWDFRRDAAEAAATGNGINLNAVRRFGILIEKEPAGSEPNPEQGSIDVSRIALETDRADQAPATDDGWLDLAERRACQYFIDWASRKPQSMGLPQDRSAFADLLAPAYVGYALPALIVAAERGWLPREEAAQRALGIVRILDDESAFGPEAVGRIGYRGWFYRYLGPDARRKVNFDYMDTPIDERLNTVEIDPVDTAQLLMGVLAAQSYFQQENSAERDIRSRAQFIFDRVDWPFMLDPASRRFRRGWKPAEKREGPLYEIPDPESKGFFAGTHQRPELYEAYADDIALLSLMAAGYTAHATPAPAWCSWTRELDAEGFMRSVSGSLSSFQLLHGFIDTRVNHAPVCIDQPALDWYENSRRAMLQAITLARRNRFTTYSPDAWGISGTEGPFEVFRQYGFRELTLTNISQGIEDGTVTYSAMISAASFGDDLKARAISAMKYGWKRGHWHSRFGLVSAFNDDIAQAGAETEAQKFESVYRRHGPWVQHMLFASQQGSILLHVENARSGLIWELLARNLNVQRAFDRLAAPPEISIEAEKGRGEGKIVQRTQARGQSTVKLLPKESRTFEFEINSAASYAIVVRYSNDSYGAPEKIDVQVDGTTIGTFSAFDTSQYIGTGSFGSGWNVFAASPQIGPVDFEAGRHTVVLTVLAGDEQGVEIDGISLERVEDQ
jgi:hypothetical protein